MAQHQNRDIKNAQKITDIIANLEVIMKEHFIGSVEVEDNLLKLKLLGGEKYTVTVCTAE